MLSSKRFLILLIVLVGVGFSLAIVVSYRKPPIELATLDEGLVIGQWEYLDELPWESASTAWLAVANEGTPTIDKSFVGGPLSVGGEVFETGIGTYPLSEIEYHLDDQYLAFESFVGVDDSVPAGRGGVIFQVYLDDAVAFSSGVMKSGEPAIQIRLALLGIRAMRLVTIDATDGAVRNYADWADARLMKRLVAVNEMRSNPIIASVLERNSVRQSERENDRGEAENTAKAEIADFKRALGTYEREDNLAVAYDARRKVLQLSNSAIGIELGYGGSRHGNLTILDLEDGRLVLHKASANVNLNGVETINLARDTESIVGGFRFRRVDDPVFGMGSSMAAEFKVKDQPTTLVVDITLFASSRYFVYSLGIQEAAFLSESPPTFDFFDAAEDNLVVDEGTSYITDFSRLRRVSIRDDGIVHEERVGMGKPVFVGSQLTGRGLLMAALDETEGTPSVRLQLDPGRAVGSLSYAAPAARNSLYSPRLYVEVSNTADTRQAFANFKRIFSALYPPLPIPPWVKYQWLSWYPFGMDISDEALREQIDYIADNLADLGPWHIIVDAGWYIAEGRPEAEWRNIDRGKFPQGLRPLVDYAHSRGIKVVLYFSTPYLDSREKQGDWLGLKGIIENHGDWLIPIGASEGRESFVYDYTNPELRAYMEQVMEDYFIRYDVDGIKIDGLGNAEGAILNPNSIDAFGLFDRVIGPTMDVYRFTYETASSLKSNVYLESGWLTPLFANQYAHTFRYGDEADSFRSPYPFPGLVEHIDYAQVQKMILGQRPNMGAIRGDPNSSSVNRWMLEAGLALGTQVVLSFYLPAIDDQSLSLYRGLLYHYNAFEGETYYGSPLYADSFATTVRGTTYLGVLNRENVAKRFQLRLSDYGLPSDQYYTVYKVEESSYISARNLFDVEVPPESFALFILRADSGVMWTNSSVVYDETPTEIVLGVRGPQSLPGFVQLMVPEHSSVSIDGQPLQMQAEPTELEDAYEYSPQVHIITVRYSHESDHEIRITKGRD